MLNNTTKYVASRTLSEPLPWSDSILLEGDAAHAVAELKQQPIGDLMITESISTSTGVVIATYVATGDNSAV